ncbi:hypothetical protein GGE45_001624 [Rhizobium aethiopicum]|uniref:Uncharacterized protein n=1 Tax=Rhizobium aethiopicum TaxID=1138170 RepID=A0A7W6Q9F6_9HYPH|nr:hypothetical protein [Rhizobium aethiopicum]MBB4193039.1 hypothetical protein [Rhizobium aethiopicum]MBB4579300.1 hypothetical protein [Rhizobium aethiopicum]
MKTPQRKFVVEFKSGRRRSTAHPGSIWGSTDIKAFVRQAETEAPHLFKSEMELEASNQPVELPQGQKLGNEPDQSDAVIDQNQIAAPLIEPVQIDPSRNEHGHVGSISQSKKISTARPASPATRIDQRRLENHVNGASNARGEEPSAAYVEAPVDELAALDAENRRLKALLIKQLRQENLQLRQMLERFVVF